MRSITPGGLLVLAAISIPFALEIRTVFGFVGIEIPLLPIVILEGIFLGLLFIAYTMVSGQQAAPQ